MSSALIGASPIVIERWPATLIAVGALVLLGGLAHLLVISAGERGSAVASTVVRRRRHGIKALVIGTDGRASTSKLQVVLWFSAVMFAYVFLLVWGRSTNCDDPANTDRGRCVRATAARETFRDVLDTPLQPEYFVLLGFPVGAALAAKALTTSKVMAGTLTKPPLGAAAGPPPEAVVPDGRDAAGGEEPTDDQISASVGIGNGLAEVISDDRGNTDLLDFQYFGFNLLTLSFFVIEFLTHPADGIPDLPPTLIALSGVSAAAYTTKKALETEVRSAITRVIPDPFPARTGTEITVIGTGFGAPPSDAPMVSSRTARCALLNGQPLTITSWSDRAIVAAVSDDAIAALAGTQVAKVVVVDADGAASEDFAVSVR